MAVTAIHIAYPVVFLLSVGVGFLVHLSAPVAAVIGVAALLPVLIADLIVSGRRKKAGQNGR